MTEDHSCLQLLSLLPSVNFQDSANWEPEWSPAISRSCKSKGAKASSIRRAEHRTGECGTQRPLWRWAAKCCSLNVCEEMTQGQGKDHLERLQGRVDCSWNSPNARNSPCSQQPEWKTSEFIDTVWNTKVSLASVMGGLLFLGQLLLWSWINELKS